MDPGLTGPPFQAVTMRSGNTVVIRLSGELDCATADQLRDAIREAGDTAKRLTLDLTGLGFIDPAGARPITEAACGGHRVTLRGANPTLRRVLTLLELDGLVER